MMELLKMVDKKIAGKVTKSLKELNYVCIECGKKVSMFTDLNDAETKGMIKYQVCQPCLIYKLISGEFDEK